MKKLPSWSKIELQTYILLLCANADLIETGEEINLIKSKTDLKTFKKIHKEFKGDKEEKSLKKIRKNVHLHHFTDMELMEFRKEINTIFFMDKKFTMMERNLDRILDNILY
ncbi:hypothetical protein [Aureibaculum conchae]|uniref:hypothetical protein n=1 Tax=Aureibaculum sp. 2308TA14-22 TaxID=3108392 RepID=UPI00339521F6